MNPSISSIHYYPVKSLSSSNLNKCMIKKSSGILNDRIFAFSRNIDFDNAKLIENFPKKRKLNKFLTLKNSPILNKYKFIYDQNRLTLYKDKKKIISISTDNYNEYSLISDKLNLLEKSLSKPIFLLKNSIYPFFDTTHSDKISNTISLININSIKHLEKNINQALECERFRGNLYVEGVNPWKERNWIDKIIRVNNVSFRVQKHIPRCSATNLKPNTNEVTINLPKVLKQNYDHFDMGIYLIPLDDGEINIGDKIILDE